MPGLSYNKVAPRLYHLQHTSPLEVASVWAGYLSSASAEFPASASLADVWSDVGGVFLFLKDAPTSVDEFSAGLLKALPQLSPTGVLRLIWIQNPNDPAYAWQSTPLTMQPVSSPEGAWQAVRNCVAPLGNYALQVHGGTTFSLDTTAGSERMIMAARPAQFSAPGYVYEAQNAAGALPLNGLQIGCLCFDIQLSNGATPLDDMDRLGVMFRYGLADAQSVVGAVQAVDMPLFKQSDATAIDASVYYDPNNPLDVERTGLDLALSVAEPPLFHYAQKTNTGHAMQVAPLGATGALVGARFGFGRTPLFDSDDAGSASFIYHLTPDGAFSLTVHEDDAVDGSKPPSLMLGASGAEYVALPSTNAVIYFGAGGDAYVPPVAPDAKRGRSEPVLLTGLATTGYATVLPPETDGPGLTYYAQPLQAPLFSASEEGDAGFLDYHQMPAASLPTYPASGLQRPELLPIGVLSRVSPTVVDHAALIETASLAPKRREIIGVAQDALANPHLDVTDDPPLAVTPKGLLALLSEDETKWAGVLFANMPTSLHQRLTLTAVGPQFQAGLQSNQLFMVVSNVDTFMNGSSVAYQLTAENAHTLMISQGVPEAVAVSVTATLAAQSPPFPWFANEAAFDAVVSDAAGSSLPQVRAAAGLLRADIEGWNFQLSPRSWRAEGGTKTFMLIKYCDRPLDELIHDQASWAWPEVAKPEGGDLGATVSALAAYVAATKIRANEAEDPADNPYRSFLDNVVNNPRWNGVLFLNAPVDFTQMPQPLQFMAAGIDTKKFYAHHVGFSVTPMQAENGAIELGQTAAFGLIDYNDPADLVASSTTPFGFKTQRLQIVFENARLTDFAARVQLMVNQLFGSWLTKKQMSSGNNLTLDGSYQRVGGAPSYSFILDGANTFETENAALASMDIANTRLETSSADARDILTARFVLSGKLAFLSIPGFDLFCFGPGEDVNGALAYDGLSISMSFPLATPEQQSFVLGENTVSFDRSAGQSLARPSSLIENFPLELKGLVVSPNLAKADEVARGASPADFGFTSMSAPIDQSVLSAPWYGLSYQLDMGTLGALSGSVGLKITLLAAWASGPKGGDAPPVFLGIKLGVSNALNGSFPLQGVLKLGFRSFQFETYKNKDDKLAYLLRMRRFALSVLVWNFPPGNADLLLFGAPENPKSALGWYAAYGGKKKATADKPAPKNLSQSAHDPVRKSLSGRRTPPIA